MTTPEPRPVNLDTRQRRILAEIAAAGRHGVYRRQWHGGTIGALLRLHVIEEVPGAPDYVRLRAGVAIPADPTGSETRQPTGPITPEDVHNMWERLGLRPVSLREAQRIADRINTEAAARPYVSATTAARTAAHAYCAAAVIDGRPVVDYRRDRDCDRPHDPTTAAGYVVRETTDGQATAYDLAVISASADAAAIVRRLASEGRTVHVDTLYRCGCRAV